MKTINQDQWGQLWERDLLEYQEGSARAVMEVEAVSVRCAKIVQYLEASLGDLSRLKTIEVGCGGAIYSQILTRHGAHPTLLDYSPVALSLAEKNMQALGLEVTFLQADAFDLPEEQLGKYDIAMSFGTVEHYRYPQRLMICQAHVDLVRPGGVVIISTPNLWFLPHELLKVMLILRRKWFLGYEGSFTHFELLRVARQLGLDETKIVGSAWRNDVRYYVDIVRGTQSFQRWIRKRPRKMRSSIFSAAPQQPHRFDDYLGYAIVLLGIKQSSV